MGQLRPAEHGLLTGRRHRALGGVGVGASGAPSHAPSCSHAPSRFVVCPRRGQMCITAGGRREPAVIRFCLKRPRRGRTRQCQEGPLRALLPVGQRVFCKFRPLRGRWSRHHLESAGSLRSPAVMLSWPPSGTCHEQKHINTRTAITTNARTAMFCDRILSDFETDFEHPTPTGLGTPHFPSRSECLF